MGAQICLFFGISFPGRVIGFEQVLMTSFHGLWRTR